jgi:L-fuconate dehydratase
MKDCAEKRETEMVEQGYPAYTTQAGRKFNLVLKIIWHICSTGWIGYSSDLVRKQCLDLMGKGFTAFKIKVGQDLQSDIERCKMVRETIGEENILVYCTILALEF